MTLQKITFEHFYLETVDTIEKVHATLLNPNLMEFFKCGPVYLALTHEGKRLIVNFALNTGKRSDGSWVEALISEARRAGFEKIVFITSRNNKTVQNIALKYECDLIKTNPNFYSDGSDAFVYEGNIPEK
jgi:hypothetical protein